MTNENKIHRLGAGAGNRVAAAELMLTIVQATGDPKSAEFKTQMRHIYKELDAILIDKSEYQA